MADQFQSPARLGFGPFEVETRTGKLFKRGVRIRIPAQPFQILCLLLVNPGQIVTREELRDRIWSDGRFVDFEHSLNVAMNRLRRALQDSAEDPRYIATAPGRGYQFIAPVQEIKLEVANLEPAPAPVVAETKIIASGKSEIAIGTRRKQRPGSAERRPWRRLRLQASSFFSFIVLPR